MNALNQIVCTVKSMADGRPFSVDGQVVSAPNWFDEKWEHYSALMKPEPQTIQAFAGEDERLILFGIFFILALAIIFRKQ